MSLICHLLADVRNLNVRRNIVNVSRLAGLAATNASARTATMVILDVTIIQ